MPEVRRASGQRSSRPIARARDVLREPSERADEVARAVLDAAFAVRRALGRGALERAYREALRTHLERQGFVVAVEVPFEASYEGAALGISYRIDLLVDGLVVVEVKAVEALHAKHAAQVLTYLKVTNCPIGLLINFNEGLLKAGIRRFVWTPR